MKRTLAFAAILGAGILASASAFAQTSVTATTDLNVRSGPGPQYPVIGVLARDGSANLNGCLENSSWCSVTFSGGEGWAFSDYLVADNAGTRVVVTQRPAELDVPVVVHEGIGAGPIAGATTGAIAGAVIGGPVGAAVGGVAGAATGGLVEGAVTPPEEVRTYVSANPVDQVYLDGELVVGASLPETVQVREIPQYEYRYVYVNGQPVLVEPETRRIVYILR